MAITMSVRCVLASPMTDLRIGHCAIEPQRRNDETEPTTMQETQ